VPRDADVHRNDRPGSTGHQVLELSSTGTRAGHGNGIATGDLLALQPASRFTLGSHSGGGRAPQPRPGWAGLGWAGQHFNNLDCFARADSEKWRQCWPGRCAGTTAAGAPGGALLAQLTRSVGGT
jgi:hypothetical protein